LKLEQFVELAAKLPAGGPSEPLCEEAIELGLKYPLALSSMEVCRFAQRFAHGGQHLSEEGLSHKGIEHLAQVVILPSRGGWSVGMAGRLCCLGGLSCQRGRHGNTGVRWQG